MPAGLEQLSVERLGKVIDALQDVRDKPQDLVFYNRIASVPAEDDEIMGRFVGRAQIADILADDGVAGTYSLGKIQTYVNEPANLKVGTAMTQSQINRISAVRASNPALVDMMITRNTDALRLGVLQRIETILIGMTLDTFNYNRLGTVISGATWGMPSDLKFNVSLAWAANPTTATPIDDILFALRYARIRYGAVYNRIDMSTAAMNVMFKTTDFQNRAKFFLSNASLSIPGNLSLNDTEAQKSMAGKILGVQINQIDSRYWSKSMAGVDGSSAFWPLNMLNFSNTADDNKPEVQDWADGETTESRLGTLAGASNIPGSTIGSFESARRGVTTYATLEGLNPPKVSQWAVARGWARKHILQANATMNIGTITDDIPVSEPFG